MPIPDHPQVYGAPPTLPGNHLRGYDVGPTDVPCRVAVMTDGRRPAVTDRCLRALRSRGGAEFEIVKTPGLGHAYDLWWLFEQHLDSSDTADLLVLEDDIVPCKNALKYMKRFRLDTPVVAMASFFDMRHLAGVYPQVLSVRPETHDGLGFMGTQAFKISAHWAGQFVRRPPADQSGDIAIARVMLGTNARIALHAPSLVQHDDPRQTLNFVGPDFDADLLMR